MLKFGVVKKKSIMSQINATLCSASDFEILGMS